MRQYHSRFAIMEQCVCRSSTYLGLRNRQQGHRRKLYIVIISIGYGCFNFNPG